MIFSVMTTQFADDTTVVGLLTEKGGFKLVCGSSKHNLQRNGRKTKEMVMDFGKMKRKKPPLTLAGDAFEEVKELKFLGTVIPANLKREGNVLSTVKLAHQKRYFLWKLRKFGAMKNTMVPFYTAVIQRVLTFSFTAWSGSLTSGETKGSKITDQSLPSIYQSQLKQKTLNGSGRVRSQRLNIEPPAGFTF